MPYFITSNKKISKTYKWKPRKNIIDIVKDTYKWMVDQNKILNKYI